MSDITDITTSYPTRINYNDPAPAPPQSPLTPPPPEIIAAAKLITLYMINHGHPTWELQGICSINHATALRDIEARIHELRKPQHDMVNTPKHIPSSPLPSSTSSTSNASPLTHETPIQ